MNDQADRLRQLVRRSVEIHRSLAPGPQIVAVSGGRSGDGATPLTCQLGRELVRLGKRIVLVDADLTGSRLTSRLFSGGRRPTRGSLGDVVRGARRAIETLVPIDDRLQLLVGLPRGAEPSLTTEEIVCLQQELGSLSDVADLVLVDAGAGMSPWIDRCWRMAAEVLLVCRNDSGSVQEAYRTLKLSTWQSLQHRVRLVVGGNDPTHATEAIGRRLADTCRQFLALEVRGCSSIESRGREAWGRSGSITSSDPQFTRSVRLLAADMLCDDGLGATHPIAAGAS